MVGGALVAAVGSSLSAILKGDAQRKASAIIGAIGAAVTILPKALPDKQAVQAQMLNAEKHRVLGTKVRNQFVFKRPNESIVEAEKYVSARFSDCSSLSPPEKVPDLPEAPHATDARSNSPTEPDSTSIGSPSTGTSAPDLIGRTRRNRPHPSEVASSPRRPHPAPSSSVDHDPPTEFRTVDVVAGKSDRQFGAADSPIGGTERDPDARDREMRISPDRPETMRIEKK